jgi:hypothetical protein
LHPITLGPAWLRSSLSFGSDSMSWDAVIVRIRGPIRPIADVAADDYLPLGTLNSVADAVRAAFPDAEWDSPSHAHRELDEYTGMMIELGNVETSNSIHVSVSGPSNPVPDLLSLGNANGWIVIDCSSSEFIDPGTSESQGFAGYKAMWHDLQRRSNE